MVLQLQYFLHYYQINLFVSVSGNGVTGISHLDGSGAKSGVRRMMEKLKQLCLGAPEGRLSICCC